MKEQPQINITIKKRFFNECYLPYLNIKERLLVLYGGAGSGKSVFGVQRSVIKLLKNKRKMLVVRKVTNTIRESIFAEFKKALSTFGILEHCKISESNFSIKLPNGSEIIFKGMDDPEKIKSIQGLDDILIEEATELTLDDYSQLNLRLRSKKKNNQIVLMYNPTSKANWVYKMFHETKPPKSCKVVHTTYKDNKFLPQTYIDSLHDLMRTNNAYYKIYALGEFATLSKTIYENWEVSDFNVMDLFKSGLKSYHGMDFGYSQDPTTLVCAIPDMKNKILYIYDEHYEKAMTNRDIYNMLSYKQYTKQRIIADSSEPKSIEELKRLGIYRVKPARKGKDSINHGIQFIKQFKIIVHPKCEKTKLELENYVYKKDKSTNEYTNEPIDNFNHILDALRYALEEVMPRNRARSMSKALLGL
ncbi:MULTISPECIES: PBSX family phage terminase large subunit [Bacillus cereus group]|uniref:PBSX family phage terminase large subunit n=1 Tax=Bacillus cereus group TaxID=86661 RepID=UPI002E2151D4|nr:MULTISPECIES: PBSX family phage terminase large subunit [Bacillus cereus group]MED1431129.1 PBSX family phage terminase large subunit [Bacillus mycoides]MED1436944.1 PBSX family phage terminase large subunit [Bacillus mycoides]MED1473212.1 PBSX family phage terminase large subunit [Bacillus pseudomycoides]